MEEQHSARGGKREGAGRPISGRGNSVCLRLSDESIEKLKRVPNKSAYVDELIRNDK